MKKQMRALSALLTTAVILGMAGCSGSAGTETEKAAEGTEAADAGAAEAEAEPAEEEEKVLTVYTSESDERLNVIIPGFEEETGIKVDLITGGAGELAKRLRSEAEDPVADVQLGGSQMSVISNEDLYQEYISPNEEYVMDGFKTSGVATPYVSGASVLLVNTDLVGNIEINGYKDLLNPELKGKIVTADAASSSSAMEHLMNILMVFSPEGSMESDEAWQFVQDLLYNIDGNVLESSSAVHKGVAEGEYAVGLTYESPACGYIRDGADNLKVVWMEEGGASGGACVMIVKNAKHPGNAQKFVDYCLSTEAQEGLVAETFSRTIRSDVAQSPEMKPTEELNLRPADYAYAIEHQDEWKEKWTECVTNVE